MINSGDVLRKHFALAEITDLRSETIRIRSDESDFANTDRVLSAREYKLRDPVAAVRVFFITDWCPGMKILLDIARISRLLVRLRSSRLPREDYRSISKRIHLDTGDLSGAIPYELEPWRRIIACHSLFYDRPFQGRIPILRDSDGRIIGTPADLTALSHAQPCEMGDTLVAPEAFIRLWKAASIDGHRFQPDRGRLRFPTHASIPAQSIRSSDIEQTRFPKVTGESWGALVFPGGFSGLGQTARIRPLGQPSSDTVDVRSYLHAQSPPNILKQCAESPRSVDVGSEFYSALGDLVGVPYFPPCRDRAATGVGFKLGAGV